jgi:putative hemolysin
MKRWLFLALIVGVLAVAACGAEPTSAPVPTPTPSTFESPLGLPNPASQYCLDQGNQLDIRTAADGSQAGYCIFPDGTECDEWAFYRKECGPGTPKP